MPYSIFTVLNSAYLQFGKIFLRSMAENLHMNNIKSVYVIDTGLKQDDLRFVQSFAKVSVINSGFVSDFSGGTWGEDWHKNVTCKTRFLRIVAEDNIPVVMVDADCMFVRDFSDLIDTAYDIQACYRPKHKVSEYLASFVSVNSNKALLFLDRWIEIMDSKQDTHDGKLMARESPSLSDCVKELSTELKIGQLSPEIVSANASNYNKKTAVVHFKSSGFADTADEVFTDRVISRGWLSSVKKYLEE